MSVSFQQKTLAHEGWILIRTFSDENKIDVIKNRIMLNSSTVTFKYCQPEVFPHTQGVIFR